MGVKFPGKIIIKVYGLTLLEPYYCYKGEDGCQISRKKRHKGVRFNVIALRGGGWVSTFHDKHIT